MQTKINLLKDDIRPIFFKYLIASIGGMLGISLYVLGDTLFVANGIGSDGLAALNISIPIINVFNGLGLLFGIGGATALSVSKGQGNKQQINTIFTVSVAMSMAVGIVLTLLGVFFLEDIALFMGASGEILIMSKDYLGILLSCSVAFLLSSTLTVFIRNDDAPGLAMWGMLAGTLSNVVLDYVFIFIYNWGMKGAAVATALSPIISLSILSTHFIRKRNTIHLEKITLDSQIIQRVFGNGLSSFITEISAGVVIFAFNIVILGLAGNIGVAAYGIIANLSLICIAIFTGVGQAVQPISSINYGAGKKKRVQQVFQSGIIVAIILGALFYGVGVLFPETLTAIFNKDNNIELANITINGMYLYFICFIFMGVNTVMVSYLQSIEESRAATLISVARGLGFIIIGLGVLTKLFGINGVWLTMPFAELLTFIILVWYIIKIYALPNKYNTQCPKNRIQDTNKCSKTNLSDR